jgi:nitric oxide reductase NorE protein
MHARERTSQLEFYSARQPGTEGLWTFVFIDMVVFLLIFVTFMGDRIGKTALYSSSQRQLSVSLGLANTLVLLTSSWMVVEAVRSARERASRDVSRYMGLAVLLGVAFIANKIIEYISKLQSGITPAANAFFSYYFFITFLHLMHVVAGVGFLTYFRSRAKDDTGLAVFSMRLENIGLFWHFVDALWLFIFALLYLVGRS